MTVFESEKEPTSALHGNELIESVLLQIDSGETHQLSNTLASLAPAELANLVESMPPEQRATLWDALPLQQEADTLPYLHDEARASVIHKMDDSELKAAAELMPIENLADVLPDLSSELSESILEALDADNRGRLNTVLAFPDGTAGRIMSTHVLSVRPDATLSVVLRWLRRHPALPPYSDAIVVTNVEGIYLGTLPMDTVVTGDPHATVGDVMLLTGLTIPADATEHDVAALFDRRELISVAVVSQDNQLLGRITIDDAIEIMREEADNALLKQAGLDEEADLFAPIIPSAKSRGVWLGINLITVFAAAWVIALFEHVLEQLVALAVLLPVVASMGGIAGSQTLTLTIRGLALDQIAGGNVRWLATKELAVGALNGLVWSLVVALITYLWFRNIGLSSVIAIALMLNLLAASISGIAVPLILKKMGLDPALSGAVVLTTITDVIGFLSLLGLASVWLLP